jgi:hypothetical protein
MHGRRTHYAWRPIKIVQHRLVASARMPNAVAHLPASALTVDVLGGAIDCWCAPPSSAAGARKTKSAVHLRGIVMRNCLTCGSDEETPSRRRACFEDTNASARACVLAGPRRRRARHDSTAA